VSQMTAYGLLSSPSTTVFIEMGAEKGKLVVALNEVAPKARVVFVERSGQRKKAECLKKGAKKKFGRISKFNATLALEYMAYVLF
jgi:hypothetical protein